MPALVTPFDDSEAIDLGAHRHNIATLNGAGVEGFLIAGSTGEGPYLEPGERRDLVRAAVDTAPSTPMICGVHAETVRGALAMAGEAADGGAAAALVVTPTSLVRGSATWVGAFYRDVADAAPIPVMLYSVPGVTGWEVPVETVNELAHHPNIVGMKDSGGDPSRIAAMRESIDRGFVVYAGASRALAASHAAGAHGAITASANYAFPLVARAAKGDQAAQEELTSLSAVIERHRVPGTKAATTLSGLRAGRSRRPLPPLTDAAMAEIAEAFGRPAGS